MKKIYFIIVLAIIIFCSCASIFNGVVLPNQCKKCELINTQNGEVLFTNEGCGSENTRLEEEAQIKAYEMSHDGFHDLCELEVKCTSWKQDPEKPE